MKVLQLTFHKRKNYGAFLQAFALQTVLISASLKPKIMDFRPSFLYFHQFYINEKIKRLLPIFWHVLAIIRYFQKNQDLKAFKEYTKLELSKRYYLTLNTVSLYDAYIVGSDQIWNPAFIKECEKIYFLDFVPPSGKRIAYAASLGMKQWPKNFEQRVLPMLRRFSAISVREESSVLYLTSLGFKNVVCTCDPTILHKADFYRKEFSLGCTTDLNKCRYAFVYKIREVIPDCVQEILKRRRDDAFFVKSVNLRVKNTVCSVTEWLRNINDAEFVVTDSFHCVVFCILFHRPFLVLTNHGSGMGMNERFQTLLGKTNLLYRALPQNATREDAFERLNNPIEWDKVDAIMDDWRAYSMKWLKQALGV